MWTARLTSGPAVALASGVWQAVCARQDGSFYKVEEVLGEGGYGAVYTARDVGTGERVAVKLATHTEDAERELRALRRVAERGDHPNIARLVDAWRDERGLCLATELVEGGELFEHLANQGSFSEATAARLFEGVVNGLSWLHEQGIIHGDVKPENLVLSEDEATVKLIDFGSAVFGDEPYCGTPHYMPPELLFDEARVDKSADAWALGVVLYVALVGAHPFDLDGVIEDTAELKKAMVAAFEDDMRPLKIAGLSPAAMDLLSSLLSWSPEERPKLEDCLSHPWFNGSAGTSDQLSISKRSAAKLRRSKKRAQASALDRLCRGQRAAELGEAKDFETGHVVFKEGESAGPDAPMFFITEGSVDIAKGGRVVAKLGAGDFFGEGGLVFRDNKARSATVTTTTPSKLVAVTRSDVASLSIDARAADHTLRAVALDRALDNTKTAIASKGTRSFFEHGQSACVEGECGDAVYEIDRGCFDVLRNDKTLARLKEGAVFGEGACLSGKPRNASVVCAAPDGCVVTKLARDAFLHHIHTNPRAEFAVKSLFKERRDGHQH